MIAARVIGEHFSMGAKHLPPGTLVDLPQPAFDYAFRNKDVVAVGEPEPELEAGTYARRDMQAAATPTTRKKRTVRKKAAAKRDD